MFSKLEYNVFKIRINLFLIFQTRERRMYKTYENLEKNYEGPL